MSLDVLRGLGLIDAAPLSLPLPPSFRLFHDGPEQPPAYAESDAKFYKSLLGSLVYASSCTRPDIATAVSILCRVLNSPNTAHLHGLEGRALLSQRHFGLTYGLSI
eukprot:scaffold73237_cov14-Prasinocladus_malaysianus.AAC.2